MSEDKEEKKVLKGFANPENRKHINRNGRRRGSKNKTMTDAEFTKAILSRESEALETIMQLMRNGKDSDKGKMAFKVLDLSVEIRKNGGKISVDKKDKEGKKDSYSYEQEDKTNNKVVSFK